MTFLSVTSKHNFHLYNLKVNSKSCKEFADGQESVERVEGDDDVEGEEAGDEADEEEYV